jgi:hypothetical protein
LIAATYRCTTAWGESVPPGAAGAVDGGAVDGGAVDGGWVEGGAVDGGWAGEACGAPELR